MIIKDEKYGKFETSLCDDGTMDTVINVIHYAPNGFHIAKEEEIRFSPEFAAEFRDEDGCLTDDGFRELSKIAVETICGKNLKSF